VEFNYTAHRGPTVLQYVLFLRDTIDIVTPFLLPLILASFLLLLLLLLGAYSRERRERRKVCGGVGPRYFVYSCDFRAFVRLFVRLTNLFRTDAKQNQVHSIFTFFCSFFVLFRSELGRRGASDRERVTVWEMEQSVRRGMLM